jgi:hypothetical protein
MTDVQAQAAIEREALRLVGRPDVRAAVTALAERWRRGTPGFLPETYARLQASLDEVVLLVALQVAAGDPRRPRVVEISAGPHEWGGLQVPGGRWGINNPDTLYFAVPLEQGSGYVLRGRPHGERPTDINISVQTPDVWGTLDSLGRRELAFEADGSFAVAVGEQPALPGANHLPISDGGTVLLIRQTLGDWTTELPYELSVERTSGPAPLRPLSEDEQARRLVERLGVVIDHSLQTLQPPVFRLPVNTVPQPGAPGDKPGYLVSQRNTLGHFRLADDEALVLVLSPGGAGYAAVAAPNVWGVTADSASHQNSLNNHQAVVDDDGRITVVVANGDPGVANWLDPGGLREGILMLRWQLLSEDPDEQDQPGVTVRQVRTADLATVLPPTTRQVGSAERSEQAAARSAAYVRRFQER